MKYDSIKYVGDKVSDYASTALGVGKAILYTAAAYALLNLAGCSKKHNIVGPQEVPKEKTAITLDSIIKFAGDADSVKNDVKFRISAKNEGWVWYSATEASGSRHSDSSEVQGGSNDLVLRNLPDGDYQGEVRSRDSHGMPFTISSSVPSSNQDSLTNTQDSVDTRDAGQDSTFGSPDTNKTNPGPGTPADSNDSKQDQYW